jgi:general nucleoside transport system permease protein
MSDDSALGLWGIPLAIFSGAIRVSTPFLFVSLGECVTERAGRVNLGLEGTLVMGAMTGYGISLLTGSPWLGVLAAGVSGTLLGALHAVTCAQRRVNDVALGIAMMLLGTGLAFFLGKPLIQPSAPRLGSIPFGFFLSSTQLQSALEINPLFIVGVLLAPALQFMLYHTRFGLILRTVGESAEAARALGYNVDQVRLFATAAGGFLAGVGGAFLSLYYPGSWNEGLSSGQGLMAVALVIFAGWSPRRCLYASLLFGGAGAIGPSLQSVGITSGYYLWNAAPYVLTLGILIASSSSTRASVDMPAELGAVRS